MQSTSKLKYAISTIAEDVWVAKQDDSLLMVFDLLDWQSPSTVLGEWDEDDDSALSSMRAAGEAGRICKELKGLAEPNSPNKTHLMVRVSDEYLKFGGNMDQLYEALQRKKSLTDEERKSLVLSSMNGMKGIYVTMLPEREQTQPARIADQLAAAQQQADMHTDAPEPSSERGKSR